MLPEPPEPDRLAQTDQVFFDAGDLEQWKSEDDASEKEWVGVPVRKRRTDEGLALLAHFEDIRRIDNLNRNEPRYWAPLSVTGESDPRFPLDCIRYPVVEITYRCDTSHAYPACQWTYPGGEHLVYLESERDWQTAALLIPYKQFPPVLTRFSIRLYGSWRTTESIEIASIRFRALLPGEEEVIRDFDASISKAPPPRHYPALDNFLPFGVYMNAETAAQLSDALDISIFDYWRLALEDVARHHHNCVVVESFQSLSHEDRLVLFDLAENFGLRLIPTFDWPMERFDEEGDALVESCIKPYADSQAVLAWNVLDAPPPQTFRAFLEARDKIAAVDANHPMAVHMRQADIFPLFAPFFAVSGFSHFKSGAPWALGDALRAHLPLMSGQQFWVTAPAFVYASDAPDWNTSPQLRLMLNTALANGARGWLAHTYHNTPVWVDGHYQRSLTGPFLTFSDLWAELGNRVERLSVMAPLLLSARPAPPPEFMRVDISVQKHPKSHLRNGMSLLSTLWLQGPDYYLFYIINNDTDQVASVNMTLPDNLPDGMNVFDTSAMVRMRAWAPSDKQRHFEMFPGQGQLFLIGTLEVCEAWRDVIARRILDADRRQAQVDMELARQYGLDIDDIAAVICAKDGAPSIEKLGHVHAARERLFNRIYATPAICETRQLLIKTSSILCGCDGALSALYGSGRADTAHEMGVRVIPLAQQLTKLRIKLRKGAGTDIKRDAEKLAQESETVVRKIWSMR
ncbi:MAG TPA: hypothetical protein ENN29_06090 [Candidatus Hydrogenedentes bacterium]|nr:hypothetical protein [Candidatus Hydrogenedentota bacterium]